MSQEKTKENLEEIEADFNESVKVFDDGIDNRPSRQKDTQELYKKDERKIERAIERSGEKLKQATSATRSGDDEDEDEDIQTQAKEIAKLDADDQVNHLIKIAERKNPYLALRIAKHLNDNYVLDELHSDLTEDRMRELFINKGFL